MEISIFLAKALGVYFTIISVGLILNLNKLRPILVDLLRDARLVLLSGIMALIFGILIVVSHNVWVMGWPVIITILGWLSVFKGVVRIFYPEFTIKNTSMWVEKGAVFNVILFVLLVAGIILLYFGYMS